LGQAAPSAGAGAQPLRVIHVGPCLVRGGAERHLLDLLRFLDPQRVRVLRIIVTKAKMVDPSFQAEINIPVEVGQGERVRQAVHECDVLLCWGLELNAWLEDCRPKLCVYLGHGVGDWTMKLLRGSNRVVDHVIAVSEAVRRSVGSDFPCTVIRNGIDSARLACTRSRQEVRTSLGFAPTDFVLGYVGRFSMEKRVRVVIETVSRLPPFFKALLVGWGAQRQELLEAANSLIPGRYVFTAGLNYLGDFYQAMDAVCLVSDQEGLPLVMLEAMMCGRPFIATRVGGVPEVIQDRINGLLVSGDHPSLAAAVQLLHNHPAWARGIAAEGRAFAEEHGHARRMAREYENLLHKLWNDKFSQPAPRAQ
jgi:glycosyltransferase involved in cell wall biosynthesis